MSIRPERFLDLREAVDACRVNYIEPPSRDVAAVEREAY